MTRIRLSKCSLDGSEEKALVEALRGEYLGMGTHVQRFESELRSFFGGDREVVALNSGTAALHAAVQALGIGPGDEVIVPSLTFVGTWQAITAAGATPVGCEVDPATGFMDVEDARRRITSRTRALLPVHYASTAPALDAARELASARGLRLIEDAAHAFGGCFKNAPVGREGDVVCFSFDGIKNITCGEGGALVTSDAEVAERARTMRLVGVERDTERRYAGARSWQFDVTAQGYRYHMSNLNAALGLAQLSRFERDLKPKRQRLARRYHDCLEAMSNVTVFPVADPNVVPHIYPVCVPAERRDATRQALDAEGIETGLHYLPNHTLTLFGARRGLLPRTEALFDQLVTLPLHPDLADEHVDRVCRALSNALGEP